MNLADLFQKALSFEFLTAEEGQQLYHRASLAELMYVADEMRKTQVPHGSIFYI